MSKRGRPRDVLLYIDACEERGRPFPVDLLGGPVAARRALPRALAELRAHRERARIAEEEVADYRRLVATMQAWGGRQ